MSVAARRIEPATVRRSRAMDAAALQFFAERAVIVLDRGLEREACELLEAVERLASELRAGITPASHHREEPWQTNS